MVVHGFMIAFSQFFLPLPIVHTISTASNLFVFLWDYWLFGVKINKTQKLGIFVGIIGVLLVVNGRIIMNHLNPNYESNT